MTVCSDKQSSLFIGGQLVTGADEKTYQTLNPATGEVLGTAADAVPQDMDRAIAAAREAFDELDWSRNAARQAPVFSGHVPEVVGFIGLGQMGYPMAEHLRDWPGGLAVYDVRAEVARRFADKGGRIAASPREVAAASGVISVMVRRPSASRNRPARNRPATREQERE